MARLLTLVPLTDLIAAPQNPKQHDSETLDASLTRFGYVEPVVLDDRTGRLVSGHGRTDALRRQEAAGALPPEGVEVDEEGRWLVPVLTGWASKDDDEAAAAVIALNRIGERGGWDPASLAEMLTELSDSEPGLVGVGYSRAELDLLLSDLAAVDPVMPEQAWVGMPEFEQGDRTSQYATTVHFLTVADAERFWTEVLHRAGPHRSAWWPAHDGFVGSSQRQVYVAVDGEEADGTDPAVPGLHPE